MHVQFSSFSIQEKEKRMKDEKRETNPLNWTISHGSLIFYEHVNEVRRTIFNYTD